MNRKKPIPAWLRKWQANRPRYENFVVPEGEGATGPAEDDVQALAKNGKPQPRKRKRPRPPKPPTAG